MQQLAKHVDKQVDADLQLHNYCSKMCGIKTIKTFTLRINATTTIWISFIVR